MSPTSPLTRSSSRIWWTGVVPSGACCRSRAPSWWRSRNSTAPPCRWCSVDAPDRRAVTAPDVTASAASTRVTASRTCSPVLSVLRRWPHGSLNGCLCVGPSGPSAKSPWLSSISRPTPAIPALRRICRCSSRCSTPCRRCNAPVIASTCRRARTRCAWLWSRATPRPMARWPTSMFAFPPTTTCVGSRGCVRSKRTGGPLRVAS